MSRKFITRVAASVASLMLYGFSSSAMAVSCSSTFSLGNLGPPALRTIGNEFDAPGSFTDCYTFSLVGSADSLGFTFEFDGSTRRDIDVTGLTLFGGGVVGGQTIGGALTSDPTASSFSFDNLGIGTYSLAFFVDVTGRAGGLLGGGLVGYAGVFTTSSGSSNPTQPHTSVPEPSALILFALGLIGFALTKRRSGQRTLGQ